MIKRIRIDAISASTPPSLFGMERRIAYAKRKYHSGLMWVGVTSGLAGVKFSGSPRRLGENRANRQRKEASIRNPKRSFIVKYGWNEILSRLEFNPVGLFEPVSWRNKKCTAVIAEMMKGRRK